MSYIAPTRKSKSSMVMAKLIADIAMHFAVEKSGFNVFRAVADSAPIQAYAITAIAATMVRNMFVAALIVATLACACIGSAFIASTG